MTENEKTYRTKTGKVVTDADIDAMADDAEKGFDVDTLKARRRGRPLLGSAPAEVVPVRLEPQLKEAVDARAAAEHLSTSEIIRRALRKYLDVA
ncbi:MAG TPA: ribbon-helix-helix domain-containing protein [Acidimicrobiia bacterium]